MYCSERCRKPAACSGPTILLDVLDSSLCRCVQPDSAYTASPRTATSSCPSKRERLLYRFALWPFDHLGLFGVTGDREGFSALYDLCMSTVQHCAAPIKVVTFVACFWKRKKTDGNGHRLHVRLDGRRRMNDCHNHPSNRIYGDLSFLCVETQYWITGIKNRKEEKINRFAVALRMSRTRNHHINNS